MCTCVGSVHVYVCVCVCVKSVHVCVWDVFARSTGSDIIMMSNGAHCLSGFRELVNVCVCVCVCIRVESVCKVHNISSQFDYYQNVVRMRSICNQRSRSSITTTSHDAVVKNTQK